MNVSTEPFSSDPEEREGASLDGHLHSSGHCSRCYGYHGVEARPRPGGVHWRTGSTQVNSQVQPGVRHAAVGASPSGRLA